MRHSTRAILLGLLTLAAAASRVSTQGRPVAGTVVTKSTRIPAGTYELTSIDRDHPALIIRGSNLTVDFSGVTLLGAKPGADPDTFAGLAVLVDGGENVTIRNLTARGYKIGVYARKTRGLHITGSNPSDRARRSEAGRRPPKGGRNSRE